MTVSPAVIVDYQVSDTQLTLIRLEHLFMDDGHGGVEPRVGGFEMPTGIRAIQALYRPREQVKQAEDQQARHRTGPVGR